MREPDIEKEQKQQPRKFTGRADTKSNVRAASFELRASSHELRASSYELRAASYELRAASFELRAKAAASRLDGPFIEPGGDAGRSIADG
jgi:hypothetical protein